MMVRICRAEDGEVFPTSATIHDIEESGTLEAFLRNEIGIEEAAALAYLSDGRRLRTDNVADLGEVRDQTIFVFNKYYLDRDPDEVAKLLHVQPPLQPPIEESQTPTLRPPELGAAFRQAAQTHVHSISRVVDSMRHQRSALRLALSVVDLHVLNVSDVVTDARQEIDKRAALVVGVDGAVDLASRVRIHPEFMSPAVRRAMDAGGSPRTLGHYVSGERIRRAVEEFHGLQERFRHVESTVKRFVDGATEVRSICADARLLDTAVALESSSQSLLGKITGVTSSLDAPIANVEPILQELHSLDVSIRDNLSSVVESKNAYTTQCLGVLRQIHTLNACLVAPSDDFTLLQASLDTKGPFSDIERLHNMVYAYGATMVEVVRRKEFSSLFHSKCQGFLEVMSTFCAAETERRQAFCDEILGQLPFDLIGMDETLPSVAISVSGNEDSNIHYTLERHDISDLLRDLKVAQPVPNDSEAVPARVQEARVQEVCTKLERLAGKIDVLESGFTDLAGRSLLSSKPPASNSSVPREHASGGALPDKAAVDNERIALLERELHLARAQLASETAARRALEDQLQNKQANAGAGAGADPDDALLGVAVTYHRTSIRALALAQAQQEQEQEAPPPSPPTADGLNLSDPARALTMLRSFDHDGLLAAIAKSGSTIRKWQRHCKGYRERAKNRIAFRDFAVGDLALFLPTRNSPLRPWAAFNVSFPHYFLQATGNSLAEQLKTREWIVARITSIVERVVEPNDPESNPYLLGNGARYHMLQVNEEEWNHLRRPSKPAGATADAGIPEQ